MAKKIRVWDGTQWQDVAPALPYTAVHSAQASMPLTGVDGQIWLDTDGTLSDTQFVPLAGGTMTGNLNVPSINSGGIAGQNYIINGGFDIWQRGTSNSIAQGFSGPDRWYQDFAVAVMLGTMERGTFAPGQTEVPGNPRYYWRINITNTNGSATMEPATNIEDVTTLSGETVTLSFWARINSGTRSITWVGRQNFGNGGSPLFDFNFGTVNITTTWQKFTFTTTVPSVSGKTIGTNSSLRIFSTGYAAAPSSYQIDYANVKLEKGSVATPFSRAGGTLQGELAACQRYYWRTANTTAIAGYAMGAATATNYADFVMPFPVSMRTNPTTVEYSSLYVADRVSVAQSVTALTIPQSCSTSAILTAGVASGLTQYRPYMLENASSTSGYIGFSAEL